MKKVHVLLLLCLSLFVAGSYNYRNVISARWGSGSAQIQDIKIDPVSGSLQTIPFEHHETHEGNSYLGFYSNTVTNTDEQTVIAFRTPATVPFVHLLFRGSATAITTMTLNAITSIDEDEGTEVVAVQRNQNSANTSLIRSVQATEVIGSYTVYNEAEAAAANITETTILYTEQFGSSGNPITKLGGSGRADGEIVLKANIEYAIILNADDDNDNEQTINLSWYEHTDTN